MFNVVLYKFVTICSKLYYTLRENMHTCSHKNIARTTLVVGM